MRKLFILSTLTAGVLLSAKFKGMAVKGDCYFGSVLGDQGGSFGVVASIIQSAKSSTADKCDIFIDGTKLETLYF